MRTAMKKAWMDAKEKLNIKNPLIHCITSPIAINDCANVVLALGAKPIMAEHPKEVEGVTKSARALGVSLANITDVRAESMMISGKVELERLPLIRIDNFFVGNLISKYLNHNFIS